MHSADVAVFVRIVSKYDEEHKIKSKLILAHKKVRLKMKLFGISCDISLNG